jgi:hypothetical protein
MQEPRTHPLLLEEMFSPLSQNMGSSVPMGRRHRCNWCSMPCPLSGLRQARLCLEGELSSIDARMLGRGGSSSIDAHRHPLTPICWEGSGLSSVNPRWESGRLLSIGAHFGKGMGHRPQCSFVGKGMGRPSRKGSSSIDAHYDMCKFSQFTCHWFLHPSLTFLRSCLTAPIHHNHL